ncbi:unnamed protein product [Brassicogethes aeneus]|uniref:Alanine--glyoxylate aminotransferase n=1 Tax=Brassicogethes aeneus TaxID=1431903 RepID=A0A9P0B2Z4_BRAAE|nr:unnamed protein product [Brassicogethes aeneus]
MDVPKPECLKKNVNVPNKLLMGPGPSNCPPRVLKALSQPILGHMHPETFQIMDDIKEGLKYIFQTNNTLTLALSCSGHGGMEAVMCNLIEEGDTILIAKNGIWGQRAEDMANRCGATVKTIDTELGDNFSLARIQNAIQSVKPKVFFIVQGESSTGVYQPLEGIGDICHRYNCLLAVDTVASLGAVPLLVDQWNIDAIYTGSQKVLGVPPGITPISFSSRAQKIIFSRKTPVQIYYLDITQIGQQWNCFEGPRIYHHTVSSSLLVALREGLALVVEEGLEELMKRHRDCAKRLYDGLEKLGLEPFVEEVHKRLPTVTTIKVPDGVNWLDVVGYAIKHFNLELSGGLGPTANKVFRIGLMGYNAKPENVDKVLKVLQGGLQKSKNNKCLFKL